MLGSGITGGRCVFTTWKNLYAVFHSDCTNSSFSIQLQKQPPNAISISSRSIFSRKLYLINRIDIFCNAPAQSQPTLSLKSPKGNLQSFWTAGRARVLLLKSWIKCQLDIVQEKKIIFINMCQIAHEIY